MPTVSGLPTIFPPFAMLHSSGEFLKGKNINPSIIAATEKPAFQSSCDTQREPRKGKVRRLRRKEERSVKGQTQCLLWAE